MPLTSIQFSPSTSRQFCRGFFFFFFLYVTLQRRSCVCVQVAHADPYQISSSIIFYRILRQLLSLNPELIYLDSLGG